MQDLVILGIIGMGILVLIITDMLILYNPKLDLIIAKNKFTLLLWYNKYDDKDIKKRVYTKLF